MPVENCMITLLTATVATVQHHTIANAITIGDIRKKKFTSFFVYVMWRYVSDAEIREEKAQNKYRYTEILHCTHSIRQLILSSIFFGSLLTPIGSTASRLCSTIFWLLYIFHVVLSGLSTHVNRKMHRKTVILCVHHKCVIANVFFPEAIYLVSEWLELIYFHAWASSYCSGTCTIILTYIIHQKKKLTNNWQSNTKLCEKFEMIRIPKAIILNWW